jgi:hypothetical protein
MYSSSKSFKVKKKINRSKLRKINSKILMGNTLLNRYKIISRKIPLNIKVSKMKTPNSLSGAGPLRKMLRDQRSPQKMMVSDTSMTNLSRTQQKRKRKIWIKIRPRKKRKKKASKSSRKPNQMKKVSSGGPLGDSRTDLIMDSISLRRRHPRRAMMTKTGMHSKNKKMTFRILKKRKKHQRSKMMKVLMTLKNKRYLSHLFNIISF